MKIQTSVVFDKIDAAVNAGYTLISEQGSSRSSKTYNTLIWLLVYVLQHPHTKLSIVRGTLTALKASVFRDLKEISLRMGIWDEKNINRTDMTISLPNGSFIDMLGTDDEQKLRGRKRDVLYVNEANELKQIDWQQLKMRTTRFAIIDYNPSFSDEHWICELNKDPRTYHFVTTYKDNPFLEQSIIDEIESLRTKNKSLWQVYGLGLMATIEGLVFPNFDEVEEIPYHKHKWIGIDLGFTNDPTAIVYVALVGTDLYIDEVCYRTEMLTSDIIKELRPYRELKIISESADPRLVEEVHRAGYNIHPVQKFKGSIEAGLTKMKELTIHITKRSTNVIREFKNYTFTQDKEGKWLNQPIDCYNHAIDAIRYVVMTEVMGKSVKHKPASNFF